MLKSTILILCLCAATLLAMPALDESSAKKFIEESSDKFLELYNDIATTVFELESLVEDDSEESTKSPTKASAENEISDSSSSDWTSSEETGFLAFFFILASIGKLQEAVENITTLSDEAYKFPIDQYSDEEIITGILKLKTMPGLLALGDDYTTWSEDDFDDYLKHENFCKFKDAEKKCKSKYGELAKILKSTDDPEELLYYWKEWRERNSPEAIKKLKTLVDLYKKLGEKFGKSPKYAWFSEYLDEHFGEDMEKVVKDLEPLYKEIHAYIRHILHEKFGDKVPESGLIPHHFYELAQAQAWKPDSIIAKDFKDVKLPVENNFKETAKEVLDLASNFMTSLGLSELPENYWTDYVKEVKKKGDDCSPEIYDGGNATYLKYCSEVNIKRFFQMHGYAARIYYANEHKNLAFAYSEPYNLQLATGEAVILSATTPKYLHEIGHKDVDTLPEVEDMNRLYRMGVHTLLTVPEYFVHVKVIADVLDGTVAFEDLNKHYWDLMKQYVGVAPPVERNAENLDFPQKFYNKIESNQQSIKFVSEVIGYQIYKTLCEKKGDYVKGDKTLQLHNCNFHKSKEAGALLKHMMQLGSKKPWKKTLAAVTGDETGMKADGMLEYFEPLQNWLHTKNTEAGVKAGW
ncbi:angiotensin-converting enzyme-like [Condylostylus longicornis]|uniref:angiotensin-converting enzyme-like n=1 Tax=Condylostylus longicornis TaxID=2530218 RepID=UPI00244E2DE3|nr:angiotensin-converting enzyme-like [Condylostylus longicornis]